MAKLYDVNGNFLTSGPIDRLREAMIIKPLSYIQYDKDERRQFEVGKLEENKAGEEA